MTLRSDPIEAASFAQLHPDAIEDPNAIRRLLERVRQEGVELRSGMNRWVDPELAYLLELGHDALELRVENFRSTARPTIFLNFELEGRPYFFAARRLGSEDGRLRVGWPARIYLTERRERPRRRPDPARGEPLRVTLEAGAGRAIEARVADLSPVGLGLELPEARAHALPGRLRLRGLGARRLPGDSLEASWAEIRRRAPVPGRPGWIRLGLVLHAARPGAPVAVERRERILTRPAAARLRRRAALLAAGARLASARVLPLPRREPAVRVVDYTNREGERLRALVDVCGDPRGAPAIVIPPAWGRTKETLLPLARTLIATFGRAGEALTVLRFDGIRKRGESHNDPPCRVPGREHHRFTVSQGVRDILATLDFLESWEETRTRRVVLVTFSAAAIEGRAAVARDGGRRLRGWVSVVGAPDLQEAMKVISGGVDYLGGAERGVRFGFQEVQGVVLDMDLAARDAIEHGLGFLDDARRDMASIRVPVTWIHGRHDAWMDLERVRDVMSQGDTSKRRLIEVPTGHQLRTSQEALEVFELVASEAGRMLLGRELEPALPDLVDLERRHRAERGRLQRAVLDLASARSFWRDYLLGREGGFGIELMTATSAYHGLMEEQIRALELRDGMRVADLGAGTGAFAWVLLRRREPTPKLAIDAFDLVGEALRRARSRVSRQAAARGLRLAFVTCDLDVAHRGGSIPAAPESYDAVLASLLLSYVGDPDRLLAEIRRVLRPGGRLVLSTLRRDADTSKIYVEGIEELRSGRAAELWGAEAAARVQRASRSFLNDAARVLDLEERGAFRFWDPPELVRRARRAGFTGVRATRAFGDPPQAVVVAARRP